MGSPANSTLPFRLLGILHRASYWGKGCCWSLFLVGAPTGSALLSRGQGFSGSCVRCSLPAGFAVPRARWEASFSRSAFPALFLLFRPPPPFGCESLSGARLLSPAAARAWRGAPPLPARAGARTVSPAACRCLPTEGRASLRRGRCQAPAAPLRGALALRAPGAPEPLRRLCPPPTPLARRAPTPGGAGGHGLAPRPPPPIEGARAPGRGGQRPLTRGAGCQLRARSSPAARAA